MGMACIHTLFIQIAFRTEMTSRATIIRHNGWFTAGDGLKKGLMPKSTTTPANKTMNTKLMRTLDRKVENEPTYQLDRAKRKRVWIKKNVRDKI